jgi:2-polyprenyl-6-hydroxyphenyl methylase / 3-demethylubiquinone-9 3-methyltransferase
MKRIREDIYSRINNKVYDEQGSRWWHADFSLSLIKAILNPVRTAYSKKTIDFLKINCDGKAALEVGCGGGFFCEEIAGLGFQTFGIDPSKQSLAAASEHASASGLQINYLEGKGEALPFPDRMFDIVFCCDVLEHVRDLPKVISEISRVLKPGGIFIYDTFNRSFLSWLVAIKVLQDWKRWAIMPPHLHEWEMFIKPGEMKKLLLKNHLLWQEHTGIMPDISVLKVWRYLHLRAKGELSYEAFGKKFLMVANKFTCVMYMGYALKDV